MDPEDYISFNTLRPALKPIQSGRKALTISQVTNNLVIVGSDGIEVPVGGGGGGGSVNLTSGPVRSMGSVSSIPNGSVTAAMLAPGVGVGTGLDPFSVAGRTITRPGLPQGVLLTGTTVVDVLNNLLYPPVAPSISPFSVNDSVREVGGALTYTITWGVIRNTLTSNISSIAVDGQAVTPTGGSQNGTRSSAFANAQAGSRNLSMSVADVAGLTDSVTIQVTFMPRMHWGSIPAVAITNANLRTLITNSDLRTTRQRTYATIGTGGGQRIAVAIPTSFGAPNFTIGGFPNTDFTPTVLSTYTNIHGATVPMTVWISNQVYNSPLDNFIIS